MLHIVNKSPLTSASFDSCLRVVQAGAAVLLIEDGIYAATVGTSAAERLRAAGNGLRIYALGPDIEARGMGDRVAPGIETVDYAGFVDLVAQSRSVQSWL